jgi:uncharacterized phage infection (PIP) family protein YhgE
MDNMDNEKLIKSLKQTVTSLFKEKSQLKKDFLKIVDELSKVKEELKDNSDLISELRKEISDLKDTNSELQDLEEENEKLRLIISDKISDNWEKCQIEYQHNIRL